MNHQDLVDLFLTAPHDTWIAIDEASKAIVAAEKSILGARNEAIRKGFPNALILYRDGSVPTSS